MIVSMQNDENNAMVYSAAVVAILVIVVVLFQFKAHFSAPKTEQELVEHLRSQSNKPIVTESIRDFAESDRDLVLEQHVLDEMREMDASVRACLERWPNAMPTAKARMHTDAAGRLTVFSIQGAPQPAEVCLLNQFKIRVLPRHAEGVVQLAFPGFDDPEATPQRTQAPRSTGEVEIYWGNGDP